MGATYTRQSSSNIVDGAVIEASDLNNEFDQLLAAFAVSTGHTHDGTAAEGGPITKLLGNTLTFGAGTAGTDITITFDGETSDGVIKWMEDEDYFEFSDDILVASTEKVQFRDTDIYINSSTDGQLDLVADTEIQIAATTIDINGNVDVSGTLTVGGALDFSEANLSNVGNLGVDSVFGDADTDTSITFSGSDVITVATGGDNQITFNNGSILPVTDNDIDLGSSSYEFKDAYFDGTVTTDALVADTANIDGGSIDGATIGTNSAITQAVIDSINIDGTTIGHTSDTDLLTLTSGVLTVAGEVSMTTLDIGGTNVTSTAAELNILDGVTSTAAELNILDGVTATATEINILDGDTSASSVTIVDADQIILNDNGTMKQVAVSALNTYTSSSIAADNIGTGDAAVTIATSSGDITIDAQAGDADIIFKGTDSSSDITALTLDMSEAGAATFNDKVVATELDISGNMDIDGTSNLDAVDIDGAVQIDATVTVGVDDTGYDFKLFGATSGSFLLWDESDDALELTDSSPIKIGDGGDMQLYHDGSNSYITNSQGALKIATETSGIAITLGHSTSEVTVADNLTITGDLTVNGTTTTVNSTTTTVDDPVFTLGGDSAPGSDDNKDRGIEFRYHDGSSARIGFFGYDDSATGFTFLTAASNSSEVFSGTEAKLIAGELDISGDVDVDGTLEADAITVDGTTLAEYIADTAGAMASSNTETGITVTYQDADNTIDYEVDAAQTGITSIYNASLALGYGSSHANIDFSTDNSIIFDIDGTSQIQLDDGILKPTTDDDVDLGTSSLKFKDGYFDGTLYADAINFNGTAIASTAAELNIMDGGTAASSITLADADRLVTNDDGTMKQVALTTLKTYLTSAGFSTEDPTALAIALG